MDELENLRKENERLQMMNENKSDLISISAHQIRTSLSAFKWTLRMFLNKELGEITDEQKSYLEKAMSNNEHILALVNSLLSLNHSSDTSITFNFKKVDIVSIIEKVTTLFIGETKNKNINLIIEKPEEQIPKLSGDEEMLIVVFQNLIENAVKYSDNDTDIKISLTYNKEDNSVLFSIKNKGIGINKEDEGNIFNKFFRAPNAIAKEHIGSGFGLFATKNIVERHHGKIWFENEQNQGTTFFVTLPIS